MPARHGAALWDAVKGHDKIWTYLGYGPFPTRAAFSTWLAERATLADPYSYRGGRYAGTRAAASPP